MAEAIIEQAVYIWQALVRDNLRASGPFFTAKDFPDLSGQTWVVTGATAGIGLELAKILVRQNAHVWIVGRNAAKIDSVLAALRALKPQARVDATLIDYRDLATVKPGIERILRSTKQLDGIIHNAGITHAWPKNTEQGFEEHLGVNTIAVQLVQDLLDPLIVNTPHGRIVWVSSLALAFAPVNGFDFENTDWYSARRAYGQSKALNYIQAIQWTRRHPESLVKTLAVHPGVIQTDIIEDNGPIPKFLAYLFGYSVEYGAHAPIYAALNPVVDNNEFIIPWGRPGVVRPDIYRAARSTIGDDAIAWIEHQIAPFK